MKKTFQLLSVLLTGILFMISCSKPISGNYVPTLSSLQHSWTIDSIVIFDNAGFTGTGAKLDGVTGVTDYRSDNKLYTQLDGMTSIGNQNFKDTASYIYKPDQNLIITNIIESGITSGISDSTKVFLLNDSHLVTGDLTPPLFGYFRKVYCHR